LTHAVAVDTAFVVDRVERALEDGVEPDGVRGRDLGHAWRRHELEVEPLVAIEPLVARDEHGQVVDRVHDGHLGPGAGLRSHDDLLAQRWRSRVPVRTPRRTGASSPPSRSERPLPLAPPSNPTCRPRADCAARRGWWP